ncbi:beta-lactamase [Massilia sp. DJPM01]|nr:beta-lactamase [Massilia sp. DJPM01]
MNCHAVDQADQAGQADQCKVLDTVDAAIKALMAKHQIPGVAVAVTADSRRCFYNFGVMSKDSMQPITSETLFEAGSITKTLTATLAAYAQADGKLSMSDSVSKYVPSLRGSVFDRISVLNVATHTAGGLPLQVPDEVAKDEQLMPYFLHWKPRQAAGTSRTYSNPSAGLLGIVAANSIQMTFADAMEKRLFPALGMKHTFVNVPAELMATYAQGYNKKDQPVRVARNVLWAETYGVKTTTGDLIRFVMLNMEPAQLGPTWQRAIDATHVAHFRVGDMVQGLMWEQYPYPLKLEQLLSGNSERMIFQDMPATRVAAGAPRTDVLMNKTGSTSGFGGYVAFVPSRKIGVVIMANKNYPIPDRVGAAYQILDRLDRQARAAD